MFTKSTMIYYELYVIQQSGAPTYLHKRRIDRHCVAFHIPSDQASSSNCHTHLDALLNVLRGI